MTVPESVLEQIVNAYREARQAWRYVSYVSQPLGMGEREYCDRYITVALGPLVWTSTTTADATGLTRRELDRAWELSLHADVVP